MEHEGPARRQGRQPRRDDLACSGCRCRPGSPSPPTPAAPTCAGGWPDGLDDEVAKRRRRSSSSRWASALGDPDDPLLVQRALRREVLDARDDGHRPQPRAQRRVGRGPRRRRPATSASPTTPTAASSRCTAGSCSTSTATPFERLLDAAKERDGVADDAELSADDLRRLCEPLQGASSSPRPATRSRRTRRAAARRDRGRVPARGTAPGPSPTARASASPTTSAPRSTCRRWCSATATTTRGTGVGFTRNAATGETGPTATSSPTRRARTSSPASATPRTSTR